MRIRSIKPEFWRSDDITALSREHRLLFIGLWSYVDDNGVGLDDFRAIAADLFALEDDPKEVRDYVRETLATLSRGLLILRYEVDGKRYLFIPSWDSHQRIDRPSKARYPRPPEDWTPPTRGNGEPDPHLRDVSRDPRESIATGAVEQGSSGAGEQITIPTASAARDPEPGFDAFWAAYPKRVEKIDARAAYRSAIKKRVAPETLLAGAVRYAKQREGCDPKYTKGPATWIRKGAYADGDVVPFARASGDGYQPWRNPADQSAYDEPLLPPNPTEAS